MEMPGLGAQAGRYPAPWGGEGLPGSNKCIYCRICPIQYAVTPASAADGGSEDAAELDRYPVGPGVQFGGDVERELQAGQRPPLQVQVLIEDRHLVLRGAFGLCGVGQ